MPLVFLGLNFSFFFVLHTPKSGLHILYVMFRQVVLCTFAVLWIGANGKLVGILSHEPSQQTTDLVKSSAGATCFSLNQMVDTRWPKRGMYTTS